jgi:hypothetical protein
VTNQTSTASSIDLRSTPTTEEMVVELKRCKDDVAYFANNYCVINDPQTHKIFKFELWDFQYDLFHTFEEYSRVIILKGRQLGVSWSIAVYALHQAIFYNSANVLLLSIREKEAQKLLTKVRFIYTRLPVWMRIWRPVGGADNKQELEFTKYDQEGTPVFHSLIGAFPATEGAGRSETASLVIADEWAFHPYADLNWAAISPTIDAGGRFIGVSTANGIGNFYHHQWQGAVAGSNGFHPLFLPYSVRPGRDEAWYELTKSTYKDQKVFQQEYPRNPIEAFISTGGCIFDLEALQYYADVVCKDPLTQAELDAARDSRGLDDMTRTRPGILSVWELPKWGHRYVLSADPAGGVTGGDSSVGYVYNIDTEAHCATISGILDPDSFSDWLVLVARAYYDAMIVPERNNHGYALLANIKNVHNYMNIYKFKKDEVMRMGDDIDGFPTTTKTKPILNSVLQAEVKDKTLSCFNVDFVFEAQAYVQKPNGKVEAEEGMHDDHVIAVGLAMIGISSVKSERHGPRRRVTINKHFKTRSRR